MEFLFVKDQSEGKIKTANRSSWETDSELKRSIKRRAVALLLDFENNRDLLTKQVNRHYLALLLLLEFYCSSLFNFQFSWLTRLLTSRLRLNVPLLSRRV